MMYSWAAPPMLLPVQPGMPVRVTSVMLLEVSAGDAKSPLTRTGSADAWLAARKTSASAAVKERGRKREVFSLETLG